MDIPQVRDQSIFCTITVKFPSQPNVTFELPNTRPDDIFRAVTEMMTGSSVGDTGSVYDQ